MTSSPSAPRASTERASEPMLPGPEGRSKATSTLEAVGARRCGSSEGTAASARSSGAPSSRSPSSAISSGASTTTGAGGFSSSCCAQREGWSRPSDSSARISTPWAMAWEMGRTPWMSISPVRVRLVRLVSSACHCWNRALRRARRAGSAGAPRRPLRGEDCFSLMLRLRRSRAAARPRTPRSRPRWRGSTSAGREASGSGPSR